MPGQQPAPEEPAPEQPAPEEDNSSDDFDFDNDDDNHVWSPPTTDEEQELMPARGPLVQAALLESFEQQRQRRSSDHSREEIKISVERHKVEEDGRVLM